MEVSQAGQWRLFPALFGSRVLASFPKFRNNLGSQGVWRSKFWSWVETLAWPISIGVKKLVKSVLFSTLIDLPSFCSRGK